MDRDLLLRLGFTASPTEGQQVKLWHRLAGDVELFIFGGFVRTFDELDAQNHVKPIPDKAYLRSALRHIHENYGESGDVCAISKSRQLMLTWLCCAYAVWEARFHPHSRVMIQSKKAEDAWALVYSQDWLSSRCGFIEWAMPPWLRPREASGEERVEVLGTRGKLTYKNGSSIWGVPQGPHMFRSYTASLAICDECCFQEEFEEAYTAALPMARKIVLVTTAAAGTFYARLVEEEEEEEAA